MVTISFAYSTLLLDVGKYVCLEIETLSTFPMHVWNS